MKVGDYLVESKRKRIGETRMDENKNGLCFIIFRQKTPTSRNVKGVAQ